MDLSSFKKFIYSQHAWSGFRMGLGTVLPGVLLIVFFNLPVQGVSCALGAFCICLVDVPAPPWRKHRHMLLGTLCIGVVSALTLLVLHHPILLWIVLLGVCFLAGLAAAYGLVATAMGIAAMLAMATMLSQRGGGVDLWSYLTWLVIGGIWYTYFCLIICRLFQQQMARRSLADCMFATADYLIARSQCYIPDIALDICYRNMVKTQVTVIDAQQEARSLVLANMFVGRRMVVEPERIRLFNIMTDIIDMHDSVLAMQVDFESLRIHFAHTDAHDFMRDLLGKTAQGLCHVAETVVTGVPLTFRFNVNAELRALEYEVNLVKGTAVESALQLAYARGRTISEMMNKLILDLNSTTNTSVLPLDAIEKKYFLPASAWDKFQWSRTGLRYALRLALAVAFGMAVSDVIGGHSIWIVITVMVVLRPGFGLTQQRNKYRLIGTLFGCVAVQAVLWSAPTSSSLFWIMAGCFLLMFGFLRLNYLIGVFFATIAILLLYHFIAPQMALVGQRAIDTMIGTVIGTVAGYVFPTWEYQLLAPQIAAVLKSCRRYADRLFAPVLDTVEYRLARRDALVALTTLSASYQRMLQEPVDRQVQVAEVGDVVLQCNILLSEIASLAHMRSGRAEITLQPLFQRTGKIVDDTLAGKIISSENPPDEAGNELSAIQLTAANIMQLTSTLTLPDMSNVLKSIRTADTGRSSF